ncbi:MAG: hypothetical protein IPH09_16490 [bacterium]|nr:hypothetical protein [bacterium]
MTLATPKTFDSLLIELTRPPIGIRSGVIPILIAAAFRAFPSAFILNHRNRGYISDIRPSDIEDLCDRPHLYSIQVRGIDTHTRKLLTGITDMFGDPATRGIETDALRAAWDSIREWYSGLSEGARSSVMVSADASALRRAIAASSIQRTLLFQALPEILGVGAKKPDAALKRLEILKEELENMTGAFRAKASEISRQCFGAELSTTSEQDAARKMGSMLPEGIHPSFE